MNVLEQASTVQAASDREVHSEGPKVDPNLPLVLAAQDEMRQLKAAGEPIYSSESLALLIEQNQGLIGFYIKKFAQSRKFAFRNAANYKDIKQAAFMGMMHAAELFDPEGGANFATYAGLWIHQATSRCVQDQFTTTPRVPVYTQATLKALGERSETTAQDPIDAINDLPNSEKKKKDKNGVNRKLSLYRAFMAAKDWEPLPEQEGIETDEEMWTRTFFGDMDDVAIPVDSTLITDDTCIQEQIEYKVDFYTSILPKIRELPERNARVLLLRNGFRDGVPMTLREVGDELGITWQGVSLIEKKVPKKILQSQPVKARSANKSNKPDISRTPQITSATNCGPGDTKEMPKEAEFVFDQQKLTEEILAYRGLVEDVGRITSYMHDAPEHHKEVWNWLRSASFAELSEYAQTMQQLPQAFVEVLISQDTIGNDDTQSLDLLKGLIPEDQWNVLKGKLLVKLAYLDTLESDIDSTKEALEHRELFGSKSRVLSYEKPLHGLEVDENGCVLIEGKKLDLSRSRYALPLIAMLRQYMELRSTDRAKRVVLINDIEDSGYRELFGCSDDSKIFNKVLASSRVDSALASIASAFRGAGLQNPIYRITKPEREGLYRRKESYICVSDLYGVFQPQTQEENEYAKGDS